MDSVVGASPCRRRLTSPAACSDSSRCSNAAKNSAPRNGGAAAARAVELRTSRNTACHTAIPLEPGGMSSMPARTAGRRAPAFNAAKRSTRKCLERAVQMPARSSMTGRKGERITTGGQRVTRSSTKSVFSAYASAPPPTSSWPRNCASRIGRTIPSIECASTRIPSGEQD